MAAEKLDLFTAGKIAQTIGVPVPQVKKAIEALKIKPTAKKGVCSYFSKDAVEKIKSAIKK